MILWFSQLKTLYFMCTARIQQSVHSNRLSRVAVLIFVGTSLHHKQSSDSFLAGTLVTALIQQHIHANRWSSVAVVMFAETSLPCTHRKKAKFKDYFHSFFLILWTHSYSFYNYSISILKLNIDVYLQENIITLTYCILTKSMLFCHKINRQCWTCSNYIPAKR